jgi:hypothetical protein
MVTGTAVSGPQWQPCAMTHRKKKGTSALMGKVLLSGRLEVGEQASALRCASARDDLCTAVRQSWRGLRFEQMR